MHDSRIGDGRAPKRVAVIGAGPSGLSTLKELLEAGHRPTCFERMQGLGGVFRFDEEAGVVYDSCRLTSSGLITAFSDYPVRPDQADHLTAGEYRDYLESYCRDFDLDRHIRFGVAVESVAEDPEGGWRVRTVESGERPREERFEAVAVCSGLNQNPHRPRFEGQDTFPGQILHSSEYRRPEQVAGKRVLVIGAGESGADVVAEVAEHASETVLSLRRGVAVLPRRRRGFPTDYRTTRISNSPAHWIFQTRHPDDDRKRRLYRTAFIPFVLVDKAVQTTADWLGGLRHLRPLLHARRLGWKGALGEVRLSLATQRIASELLRDSGGVIDEQFGTKTDDFVRAMAAGRCTRVAPVTRFEGRRVVLADGEAFEADVVILCTGFEPWAPFLDDELVDAQRYMHAFVPAIGPSLAFIGFVRPAFGAIPPIAELQARWFAALASERAALPSEAEMEVSIERLLRFRRHYFRVVRGRLDQLVDFTSYCDALAAMIGCKPTRSVIRREGRAFRLRFYASPFVSAQYRLVGPHAKPEIARRVIAGLPVAYPAHALGAFYLRWVLSRTLHRLLGPRYATKLGLS